MALFTAFINVVEAESPYIYPTFKQEFDQLAMGTFALPINFPGTNYHRALKVPTLLSLGDVFLDDFEYNIGIQIYTYIYRRGKGLLT